MSMEKVYRVLAVNPGSTSTKIAVYDNETPLEEITVRHEKKDLAGFSAILDQQAYREETIKNALKEKGYDLQQFDVIVGRGGLIYPIVSGVYEINEEMMADLRDPSAANHASSLGGIIAKSFGDALGVPSYIVDPVVVDERYEIAKITGLPEIKRNSIWHALNQKAVARKCAEKLSKPYEDCCFVVAHMGGGISVGAHYYGKVVDVTDGLYGEGPLTPERSGALPAGPLVDLCFSGKYTHKELKDMLTKSSGLLAHLGTNSMIEAEQRFEDGDEKAKFVLEAMAFQTAKYIGSMAAAMAFQVDAVILTGGLAYGKNFTAAIRKYVEKLAEIIVYPGEDEMLALVSGAVRVMRGGEQAKVYGPDTKVF